MIDEQEFDGPRPIQQEELAAAYRLDALCFPGFVEEIDEQELQASYIPPRRGGLQVICHRGVPICQIGITHGRVSMYGSDLRIACPNQALKNLLETTNLSRVIMVFHSLRDATESFD